MLLNAQVDRRPKTYPNSTFASCRTGRWTPWLSPDARSSRNPPSNNTRCSALVSPTGDGFKCRWHHALKYGLQRFIQRPLRRPQPGEDASDSDAGRDNAANHGPLRLRRIELCLRHILLCRNVWKRSLDFRR